MRPRLWRDRYRKSANWRAIHIRWTLPRRDLPEPACMLDSHGADADPHRPGVVLNQEQRGPRRGDEIKLDRLHRDGPTCRPIAFYHSQDAVLAAVSRRLR